MFVLNQFRELLASRIFNPISGKMNTDTTIIQHATKFNISFRIRNEIKN